MIQADTLFLTPNRRMAAFLQRRDPGRKVLALSLWCDQLYAEFAAQDPQTPRCLSSHESRVVWEQIVRASVLGQDLLQSDAIARRAYEAWGLCQQWRIRDRSLLRQSQNGRLYESWSMDYQVYLHEKHCVDAFTKVDYLIKVLQDITKPVIASAGKQARVLNIPQQIHCLGFQEIIPQHRDLLEALAQGGVQIHHSALATRQGVVTRVAVPDPSQALKLAVHYAKQCLEASPTARIGIVIPDLVAQRDRVHSAFSRVLPTGSFGVSGPPPLQQYPMMDAALRGLDLAEERIPLDALSYFLRSPFWGESDLEAMQARAAFDVYLRTLNQASFRWKSLTALAADAGFVWWFPIEDCLKHQDARPTQQSACGWVAWMQGWLKILGWPGTRALNETEQALLTAFEKLLESYCALESVLGLHTYSDALAHCRAIAEGTPFLAKDGSDEAPIQVLGLLEAAGLRFDRLWVMGMNHSQWPPSPDPNPFIPLAVQIKQNIPRCSIEREAAVAGALTQDFCHSADRVIFSYASVLDDQPGQVSALLKALPEETLASLGLDHIPSYLGSLAAYQVFDQSFTENGPAIKLPTHIKGGTRALQLQALCPFRAFAERRLGAEALKTCSVGLSAAQRGILMHTALEYVWKTLKTQKKLLEMTEDVLREYLRKAITKACATLGLQALTGLYRSLEEASLLARVERLIIQEKKRPAFEVLALEASHTLDCQGLHFKVRIDRIDRIEGLGEVLIDYKTGKTSVRDWFGPRPRDLQLPLYAVGLVLVMPKIPLHALDTAPAALVFGGLHPDQIGFKGVARVDCGWAGVKAIDAMASTTLAEKNWEQQMQRWQQSLDDLALEFGAGVARVDPLEGAKTCRHCSLKTLCRVQQP